MRSFWVSGQTEGRGWKEVVKPPLMAGLCRFRRLRAMDGYITVLPTIRTHSLDEAYPVSDESGPPILTSDFLVLDIALRVVGR